MSDTLPGTTRARLLAAALVIALCAAAYGPALSGELLSWDDDRFVEQNALVHGLSGAHLKDIFGAIHQEAYHPLHLLSYSLDYALYRLWAPGYHLHNLLLYLLALLLAYRLLLRLELSPGAAFAGILLFAVHPLHVEAVAWISARKEPLSLCFMLGAALWHLRAESWRDWRRYLGALLFVAALLTKTSTVILPLLLLAAEVLVLRRRLRASLCGILPLLALALGVGLYVLKIWHAHEMVRAQPAGPGGAVALVLASLGHYTTKLLLPVHLSPLYPVHQAGRWGGLALLGAITVVGIGLLLWRLRDRQLRDRQLRDRQLRDRQLRDRHLRDRQLRLALVWWIVALLPVLNVIPVYFFVQDRYAFIASFALTLALAALLERPLLVEHRRLALAVVGVLLLAATVSSGLQSRHWRTSRALFERAAAAQPLSYYAHLGLGHARREANDFAGAVQSYRRAIALQPELSTARIALCLATAGQLTNGSEAPARIERSLRERWLSPAALLAFALELFGEGELTCAALAESRSFELQPPPAEEWIAAASRWTLVGQSAVALQYLRHLEGGELPARLAPAYYEVQAQALLLAGKRDKAAQALGHSLSLAPRAPAALQQAAAQFERHRQHALARFYREWASRAAP